MENEKKSKARILWEIFFSYLKSMLFAFTGGNVTLPLLQQQLGDRYHLIEKDQVLEYFALGHTLPGVISLNSGIMIGRHIAGWPGAIAAAAGTILPALCGMLFIAFSYGFVSGFPAVQGAINGIRAASIAIILYNAILIIGTAKGAFSILLAVVACFTTLVLGWNIVLVVLLCGLAGVVRVALLKRKEAK